MYQQPYDTSMKAMLQDNAPELVSQFLPGAIFLDALDVEILPAVIRADQVYRVLYNDLPHIFHLEFQSTSDEDMPKRLLHYHVGLLDKHNQPVISLVIYLFKCSTPTPPFRELSGKREILTFQYQVLECWELDARQYLQKHALSMYSLLPTMNHADPSLLQEALEELIVYYKDDEAKLVRSLLWFSTFLKPLEKVSPQPDLEKVRKRLDLFDKLLEDNDLVMRQRALGLSEGEKKGKIEGAIHAFQETLLDILQTRYPTLAERVQTRITQTNDADTLRKVIKLLINTTSEQEAYSLLDKSLA